jgi:hypothetical protein
MGKLTDFDWWMGRTPEQKARKQEARDQLREEFSGSSKSDRKSDDIGKRISRIGWQLTVTLTLPILGFVLLGWIGLLISLVIAVAYWSNRG